MISFSIFYGLYFVPKTIHIYDPSTGINVRQMQYIHEACNVLISAYMHVGAACFSTCMAASVSVQGCMQCGSVQLDSKVLHDKGVGV